MSDLVIGRSEGVSYPNNNLTYRQFKQESKQPYQCPICFGNGMVADGFYNRVGNIWTSSGTTEKCRCCDGKGIIWG